jgi:membrane protein YdbS with pleckstrin-like domain
MEESRLRELPKTQISLKALTVWKLSALISAIIFFSIVVAIGIGVYFLEFTYWITVAAVFVWLVISLITIFVIPKVKHRVWRYEVHEHEIDLQYGLFVIKRVLIPMVRVQHVDTHQGPLLRKYQLASVEISTAATKHEIPALDLREADILRDHISRLARVTDDDV